MVRTESVNQTYVRKFEKLYRTKPASLVDVVHRFGSEEICREYLERLRWPNGVACPRCASTSVSEIATRHQFDCNACRFRFSVTSGTLFDNTKLPLWKWFAAAYLMVESKKSMSANQVKRTIGTTYKTAWYLCHRIREAMETLDEGPTLFGIIELDETMLTPAKRYRQKGHQHSGIPKGVQRIWVAGALQRSGQVRLRHIPNVKKETIHAFVKSVAKDETEAFYTDELRSYLGLADDDTRHETVNHSAEEWVVGSVHTNGIEGVWSLFKRSIIGAYHKVSVKHLDAYLQELEFRFNNRDNQHMLRDVMLRLLGKSALRYSDLTETRPATPTPAA
ncbi:MAG: IS1595 family transposase [Gemmatimonadaceae bacterium]